MALVLAAALSVVGYCRVIAFTANTSSTEALAVAASLFLIVALSIVLGAAFPIFLEKINAGASNAATTIQVVMGVPGRAHQARCAAICLTGRRLAVGAAAGGCGDVRWSLFCASMRHCASPGYASIFSSVLHR